MNCLYTALAILVIVDGTASQSSIIGDGMIIEKRNGSIHCDILQCPSNAVNCHAHRQNDPKNDSQIVKSLKCVASDGNIVAEQDVYEPNTSGNFINQDMVSAGAAVRPLTREEEKELDDNIRRANEEVEKTFKGVFESLRPFKESFQFQTSVFDDLKNMFKN